MTGFDARADVPHFVYELIDAAGTHLYVGCTSNLPNRLRSHSASKEWAEEIVRVEASRYPHKLSALEVEKELIQLYQPRHNAVYTDEFGPAGWGRRRRLMAEAHAAGRPCRDRTCKAGCHASYHAENRQCPKGSWGGSSSGCGTCAALMPATIYESGDTAEIAAWQEIARRRGGLFANDLLGWTTSADEALTLLNGGLTISHLKQMRASDVQAWLDEQRDSA